MSGSIVFYRFKAQKEASTVQFEGTGISVWDLKKEILAENKLGKGADFDFAIYNADTNEEYSDDKAIVPRSTSVIARRLPPSKPGRGNAQYYMVSSSALPQTSSSGNGSASTAAGARRGHFSKRFDGKEEPAVKSSTPIAQQPEIEVSASTDADEAAKIAAMFATTNSQWKDTQEKMSTATPVFFGGRRPGGGGPRPAHAAADKPVPPNYICYRCGQAGHWIQDCPTNDKPEWDNKPRIKRTTGIPKSFLQTVEGPTKDGENQAGIMITAEGGFVIARPDAASWEKHRAVTANLTSSDIQNAAPTDPDLTCQLCKRLLRDAVKTPCCSTSYCEECIHNYLSENDFVCPECESKIKSLKILIKDEDRRTRAKQYLEDTLKASKAVGDAERKAKEGGGKPDETQSQAGSDNGNANAQNEDGGTAEEGEVYGEEQSVKGRSASPRATRAASVARSEATSKAGPSQNQQNATNANGSSNSQSQMQNGMQGNMNGGMNQMNQMNQMFNQFSNNFGNSMPPQLQMIQAQIQQTMNILQSPSLPPQMRMQLMNQLQGLQFQYAQMTQMMGQGGFGGMPMQQQMMMAQQMQQMQMAQMAMMQNGGMQGNFNNYQQPQRSYGVQFEEDSPDSPYMRVPANPKFRQQQSLKRERPEDFTQLSQQQIRRM